MKRLICIFFILPFIISCHRHDNLPGDPVKISLTQKQASLIDNSNEFAFSLFRKINQPLSGTNTVISPFSISVALTMAANGARNATLDSMLFALRLQDSDLDEVNSAYHTLLKALLLVDNRVALSIANSVWAEKEFPVKRNFSDILTQYYDAESKSFDITDPAATDPMNAWIFARTNGLIQKMLDRLEGNTVMLLINAIYFKGEWRVQFESSKTTSRPFTTYSGALSDIQTMNQTQSHLIYLGDGFKMAELPYGQGNWVMDIILPDNNNLEDFMSSLTGDNFLMWLQGLNEKKVNVYLPRFKYSYKQELRNILADMGMGIAFSDTADFGNISNTGLYINTVLHNACIETNEEGTEVAAATVVGIGNTSTGPDDPVLFDVNHQFIYIIRESTTNTILFLGKISTL